MSDDFDSIRAQAMKYALDMQNKSTNNKSANTQSRNVNNIYNAGQARINKSSGDIGLILALILLLNQDGADMPLMLALIYILT